MSESVSLPALGDSVTEGTVTRWLKNVGDHVDVDEPLLEVSTDKVDTEIPSPVAGVLQEILVQEDDTVEVGAALATVGEGSPGGASGGSTPEGDSEPEPEAQSEPEPAPESAGETAAQEPTSQTAEPAQPSAEDSPQSGEASAGSSGASDDSNAGYVTPLVRQLAHQKGVDLASVTGSGVGGRIRKEDVLAAADAGRSAGPGSSPAAAVRGTREPLSRLRKVAAEQAAASSGVTAQVTTVIEVDVTAVDSLSSAQGVVPYVAKAAVEGLRSVPIINAALDGDDIVYPSGENLSVSVETERGLLSPVISGAGNLSLRDLGAAVDDVAERARRDALRPDELSGGTFTLADSGRSGALLEAPLVYLPQSAVLSVGAVVRRPVVVESDMGESVAVRSMVYLALSYDQRVIDGSDASRYLSGVKTRLEQADF